jgi:hypothetical protein
MRTKLILLIALTLLIVLTMQGIVDLSFLRDSWYDGDHAGA